MAWGALAVLWLLVAGLAGRAAAEEARAGPRIKCGHPEYDFGMVDPQELVRHTFVLENNGSADLAIKQIHTPCGCTTVDAGVRTIPPGGSSGIEVRLSLAGRKGFVQKSVYVESNDPGNRTLRLTLRGSAGALLDVQPPYLVLRAEPGKPAIQGLVTLEESAGLPFRVLGASSRSGLLEISAEQQDRRWVVRAKLAGKLSPGQHADQVTVETDHPARRELLVDALILVAADVVVAPESLVVAEAPDSLATRTLVVKSGELKDLSIDAVDLPDPSMTVRIEPLGAAAFRIVIGNIRPAAELNGKHVRIRTGGSEPRLLDVPFSIQPGSGHETGRR